MESLDIGILHPGQMGVSIAASAQKGGHRVFWASEGRSRHTRDRATSLSLEDAKTLAALCSRCSAIVSVCPPRDAEAVAREVVSCGFSGIYVDGNAISPQRVTKMGRELEAAGIDFVDGGIVGPPAWQPRQTWLHVSGQRAADVAGWFAAGPIETVVLGEAVGRASALKMCFAAYTKGMRALLCAVLGTAESFEVRQALYRQWNDINEPDFVEKALKRVSAAAPKAWRFEGEMAEIAATFGEAGLPEGFHRAAGDIYHRLAGFKDASEPPAIDDMLDALLKKESEPTA